MPLTSIPFLFFFCIFFLLYWLGFSKQLKLQNLLLLLGSYVFYAWADWHLLLILILISVFNFGLGIYIEKFTSPPIKSRLLLLGLIQGIGGLFFYKYLDFFITSFDHLFIYFHINLGLRPLNWAAPLGISFFTFKTISYLLDISNRKIKACKNWVDFFVYLSFFPTILSGPIDKAKTFIPQLETPRIFYYDQAAEGMRQILWGLFKKSVIADNCATVTNPIFDNYSNLPASSLLIGAILYSFQIYADFSGYSDMAIGFSRLIGFNVIKNFEYPFFAQNIAEFWRKWHMSLTSWLTEYVFTPLSIAFRNWGDYGLILAIVINFTIIGIWHGANWTYVLFGFLHGCYYIPLILRGTMNKKQKIANGKMFPSISELTNVIQTFALVTFTFIILGQRVFLLHLVIIKIFFLSLFSSGPHLICIPYSFRFFLFW